MVNLTDLSNVLNALGNTPGALQLLGGHLSSSNEAKALGIIDAMSASPSTAASLVSELTTIPNLPATVTNWVNEAIANPAQFATYMANAKDALLQAMTNSGTLGGLLGL